MNDPHHSLPDEADYLCDSCGERIVIPIDPSSGREQEFVEDCPVCCNANVIRVSLEDGSDPRVSARSE